MRSNVRTHTLGPAAAARAGGRRDEAAGPNGKGHASAQGPQHPQGPHGVRTAEGEGAGGAGGKQAHGTGAAEGIAEGDADGEKQPLSVEDFRATLTACQEAQ